VAQQTVIVVLAITRDGGKVPLGLRLGSTENAVVCTELLQDLLARGLTLEGRVLWVIDGGKGLRKPLGDVVLSENSNGAIVLRFSQVIPLFGWSWSDGFGSSLGHCDQLFVRIGSWRWRTSHFDSKSPCGRRVSRGHS